MKLIIDIPEDCLEDLNNIELNELNEGVVFHTICCVRNGIPLEEELEKIKAEIEEVQSFSFRTRGECEGLKIALEIIDKHIKEIEE